MMSFSEGSALIEEQVVGRCLSYDSETQRLGIEEQDARRDLTTTQNKVRSLVFSCDLSQIIVTFGLCLFLLRLRLSVIWHF